MPIFDHLLVATDFSQCAERALALAVSIARRHAARLTVVHVCEVPVYAYGEISLAASDLLTPITEAADVKLKALVRTLRDQQVAADGVLEVGVPWEQVLKAADEVKADLIVIATHGRRGFAHAVLGSVAEKVVRMAPVPVMTVRGDGK